MSQWFSESVGPWLICSLDHWVNPYGLLDSLVPGVSASGSPGDNISVSHWFSVSVAD